MSAWSLCPFRSRKSTDTNWIGSLSGLTAGAKALRRWKSSSTAASRTRFLVLLTFRLVTMLSYSGSFCAEADSDKVWSHSHKNEYKYVYINPFKTNLTSILSKISIRKGTPVSVMPTKHSVPYKKTTAVSLKPTQIYKFTVVLKVGILIFTQLATKLIAEI